jgi:hypothetical protein
MDMNLDEMADELYATWLNGNLSVVADTFMALGGLATSATNAILALKLGALMNERERMVLVRMLKDKT